MIHVEQGVNSVYAYSNEPNLTDWILRLFVREGRELNEIEIPLVVSFFGNSFYQLTFTPPALSVIEYDYEILSSGVLIDKGILRNGTI